MPLTAAPAIRSETRVLGGITAADVAGGTLLHDLGLTDGFTGAKRFEIEGADAARAFAREHGLEDRRVQLI